MMFNVEYSNQALKFLDQADRVLAKRLLKKIEALREQSVIPKLLHITKVLHFC